MSHFSYIFLTRTKNFALCNLDAFIGSIALSTFGKMQGDDLGSIKFKPVKPLLYDGRRDFITVNSCLYQMDQYFGLLALSSNSRDLEDSVKISYGSSFISQTVAAWWFTIVQSSNVPKEWGFCKMLVTSEFVPKDYALIS